ncbi:MAG: hypothetical protein KAS72_06360 [Phycisphaerales bacterium]|nr:hypothetical protein [Phycisphaerales bacterium]
MKTLLVKLREHGVMGLARRLLDTPRIALAAPIMTQPADAPDERSPAVHCMCGRAGVIEAIWSLTSFYRFAEVDWPLVIHGDGSLRPTDVEMIHKHFPRADVITRTQADAAMQPILEDHPHCRLLRSRHVFGLRLLDSEQLCLKRTRINIDTDVLFFRKPTELLDLAVQHDEPNVFNREVGAAGYAVKGEAIAAVAGRPVPDEINAGLAILRRGTFPLDELEDLLAAGAEHWDTYLQEQTLTAVCSVRRAGDRGVVFLPERYQCDDRQPLVFDAAARHYYILARRLYYAQGLRWLVREGHVEQWSKAVSGVKVSGAVGAHHA